MNKADILKMLDDSLREKYKDLQSVNLNIIKEKEVLKKRYEDILEENIHLNMTEETIEEKIEPTKSSNTFMDKVLISIIWSPIIFSVFIFLGYFYNALPEQKYASQTISAPLKVKSAPLKVKAAPFKEPVKKVLKSIELISTQDCISNIKYLDKNHDIHEELIWEWTEYAGFENTKSRYLVDGRDNWKYNIERNISIDNYIVMQCENHPPLRTNNPNLNDRYRRATEKMSK
ncbi:MULTISPECIES: hypothetical protein [Colwellia]|uniref:Uncharacterized protein n=1 Tax=Colwellia marinimaniae TaxID=1513592 RepID=A0ABQ0MZ37_9GAMM|nr:MULTISPECIES: hypothetical protein [Colwellia]GAW97638.1 hypothetical protein MTCD1_03276 [Colwellia marinimaniae]